MAQGVTQRGELSPMQAPEVSVASSEKLPPNLPPQGTVVYLEMFADSPLQLLLAKILRTISEKVI